MNTTVLTPVHESLGAKMIEYAGYKMPVEYSGVQDEHVMVRRSAGIFDVSHMGEFIIRGHGAFNLIQHLTTNNLSRISPGKAQYSCMPNGKGGIVDDLIIYRLDEDIYFLVVNAANIQKDWHWITSHNRFGAMLENVSQNMSLLALQGPEATSVLQDLTKTDISDMGSFTFHQGTIAGVENVIISATGYTGAGGFELYCESGSAEKLWARILEKGADKIKPIGLAARDTLRLEMGYCLYGNDIDDTTSPIEAGLGWITKFVDGNDFIDRELLARQKKEGITRGLVGFEMIERGIPRHDYPVLDMSGKAIGRVTSGTMSPIMKKGIGMGYVPVAFSAPGSEIAIGIRNKQLRARVVSMPFYKG